MNIKEACKILELPESATPEEAKKQFRKMSKKLHPDNQETGNEASFKKLNEAYQIVSSGKSTDPEDLHWNQSAGVGFSGFTNPFGRSKVYFSQNVISKITISFTESVLGCQKAIKLTRKIKCDNCNGEGCVLLNNGCIVCGGRGRTVIRQGNTVMMQQCGQCNGRNPTESCKSCQSKGVIEVESVTPVNIPGGVVNGNTLVLRGIGNFGGCFGPLDQYSDAHLAVTVIPEPGLSLEKSDVISHCEVSLQEAIGGCKKIINTIEGYHDIEIKTMSRHKDEIILPNLGVNKIGNQRVILDVKYPQDVSKLLEALNNVPNDKVN
jgi:molecular chaperone DnaJ